MLLDCKIENYKNYVQANLLDADFFRVHFYRAKKWEKGNRGDIGGRSKLGEWPNTRAVQPFTVGRQKSRGSTAAHLTHHFFQQHAIKLHEL